MGAHLRRGVPHGYGEPGAGEHGDIVGAVADHRDLFERRLHQPREFREAVAFVGAGMGDVEIIVLGAHDVGLVAERFAHLRLAGVERRKIGAHGDDLGAGR